MIIEIDMQIFCEKYFSDFDDVIRFQLYNNCFINSFDCFFYRKIISIETVN